MYEDVRPVVRPIVVEGLDPESQEWEDRALRVLVNLQNTDALGIFPLLERPTLSGSEREQRTEAEKEYLRLAIVASSLSGEVDGYDSDKGELGYFLARIRHELMNAQIRYKVDRLEDADEPGDLVAYLDNLLRFQTRQSMDQMKGGTRVSAVITEIAMERGLPVYSLLPQSSAGLALNLDL